jgi:hypothetical protein
MANIVECFFPYHNETKRTGDCCPACLGFEYVKVCAGCDGAGFVRQVSGSTAEAPKIAPTVRCTGCNGRGSLPMCKEDLERIGFKIVGPA